MDKPKRWVKNVITFFNPMAGFVHIWPRVKTTRSVLLYITDNSCYR